jgi:ABC-2 type transport system ATP-binding protein
MIRVIDVTHQFGGKPVLQNVSLEVRAGEILTLIGPNGMGKSTLLNVIAGTLDPLSGVVEIDGKRRRSSVEAENAIRAISVFLPTDPWLPSTMTIRQWLWAVGELWSVPPLRALEHIGQLLTLFDLPDDGDVNIARLSTGQKSKVAIAAVLLTDAKVLVLDEPFGGGLDPAGVLAVARVLKSLSRDQGRTIVIASPVPDVVDELSDRVAIVRDGQIGAIGTIAELQALAGVSTMSELYGKLVRPDLESYITGYLEKRRPG